MQNLWPPIAFKPPPPQPQGANPWGLQPNALCQADVTHIPNLDRLKHVHVIIDTCSGATYAQAYTGEKDSPRNSNPQRGIFNIRLPLEN